MPLSPHHESTSTTADDVEWCHDAVQDVSRTFAITVDVLEEPMATYICVGYLLCRVPDTIEDAAHVPPDEQARLLHAYDRVLAGEESAASFRADVDEWLPAPEERSPDWDVVADAPRVLRAFGHQPERVREAIRPPARELVRGMALFVERYAEEGGLRIQTREELRNYCHYAAGTVGELVTNLVGDEVPAATRERLYETAESFGLTLQLVNVAKDVRDDFEEENNVYLPAADLRAEGVEQDAVCAPENRDGAARVVEQTAAQARSLLDDAQAYLELVPATSGNSVAAWAIPYLLAVGTLREIRDRPEDALREADLKVSRQEVAAVIDATLQEGSRERLGELRATIDRTPLHQA